MVDKADKYEMLRVCFIGKLKQHTSNNGHNETAIPGLSLYKYENPTAPLNYLQEPGICLIAQGAKRILTKNEVYQNDPDHYLLTILDLPVITEIVEASIEKPYLAIALNLDLKAVSHMILDENKPTDSNSHSRVGMTINGINTTLVESFIRLLNLMDEPENIPMLAPIIKKEIIYRLLISDQGPHIRQIALAGSNGNQIVKTIEMIKKNYSKVLKIDDLASYSKMSTSSFHHHFKELTDMSPLQYQKWLRLQEARRLMLSENLDAANAGYRVGYESPSQFSREYSRLFNVSPSKDIKMLRM